jgi:hypothetical protein
LCHLVNVSSGQCIKDIFAVVSFFFQAMFSVHACVWLHIVGVKSRQCKCSSIIMFAILNIFNSCVVGMVVFSKLSLPNKHVFKHLQDICHVHIYCVKWRQI